MQRFIAVRALQSLLALWVMSLIVFGLARLSGNPLDVMLPIEATSEDYERLEKHWGLDKPIADAVRHLRHEGPPGRFRPVPQVPGAVRHGPSLRSASPPRWSSPDSRSSSARFSPCL